jgi:hypothetical protein
MSDAKPRLPADLRRPQPKRSASASCSQLEQRRPDVDRYGQSGTEPTHRPLDAIEIGPAGFPVLRVPGDSDPLVRPEFDEFERAGANRMRAHLARQDVTGVDRRPAGGQQRGAAVTIS